MKDEYRKPYTILFNAITDALDALQDQNSLKAQVILIQAQKDAEEAYIDAGNGE